MIKIVGPLSVVLRTYQAQNQTSNFLLPCYFLMFPLQPFVVYMDLFVLTS